jgi:signal transduction histidine kinase
LCDVFRLQKITIFSGTTYKVMKSWLWKVFGALTGNPKIIGYDNQFLLLCLLMTIIASIAGIIIDPYLELDPILKLITYIGLAFYIGIYILVRRGLAIETAKWLFTISLFIYLDFLWFKNYGSDGPILNIYIIIYAVFLFMWDSRPRLIVAGLFILNTMAMFWFEITHDEILGSYKDVATRLTDVYLGILIYLVLASVLMIYVKRRYIIERQRAQYSDRLKSAFLANMSHEIRTPMNSILGFTQLLERNISDEKRALYIKTIHQSGHYLKQLIDDIIDISKIEAGELKIHITEFHLKVLFQEIYFMIKQYQTKLNNFSVKVTYSIDPENLVIFSDQTRIKQIITNLLTNAVKFTEEGLIDFSCHRLPSGRVLFEVKDTGIGIKSEDHEEIFKRFRKLDSENGKVYPGTGIGLSITRNLVELLDGSISVWSMPGKGTTFCFELPAKTSVRELSANELKISGKPFVGQNEQILIVEDEEINYLYLSELLENSNVRLLHAENAEQALNILVQNKSISLTLLDIKLPGGMNGLELAGIMKKKYPHIPIIAQSAYAMENDRKRCIAAGCVAYIAKPIDGKTLLDMLERFLHTTP